MLLLAGFLPLPLYLLKKDGGGEKGGGAGVVSVETINEFITYFFKSLL